MIFTIFKLNIMAAKRVVAELKPLEKCDLKRQKIV